MFIFYCPDHAAVYTHTSVWNIHLAQYNFNSHLMSLLYCCTHAGIRFEVNLLLPTEQLKNSVPRQEARILTDATSIINNSRILIRTGHFYVGV